MILALPLGALEKKPVEKIDLDQLIEETLLDVSRSKDHIAFVWYIPNEYWNAVISQNPEMNQIEKVQARLTMNTLSVVAVIQGDVSPVGPVRYYERVYLQETAKFHRVDAEGKKHELFPYKTIAGDVKNLLDSIAPALGASVGALGDNLQFFVFNDLADDGKRSLDPYQPGGLQVDLKRKNNQPLQAKIEFPLNSLYVPRRCPNGKPAHVSWKFCPWTGAKLPE